MAKETFTKPAEAQIRSVIESWAQAMRVKDAAGVVAHQTQDCVQFDLAPPLRVVGPDQKGLQDWFETWRGQIGYTIRDLHVTVGDDVAFCHGLIHLTGNRTDGSESDVRFRNTLCLAQGRRRMEDRPWPRIRSDVHGRKLKSSHRP
jgi:PhnB protein